MSINPIQQQDELNQELSEEQNGRFEEKKKGQDAPPIKGIITNKKMSQILIILRLVLTRLCIIIFSLWSIFFAACITQNKSFWSLTILIFLIVLDTTFIGIFRKGTENDW